MFGLFWQIEIPVRGREGKTTPFPSKSNPYRFNCKEDGAATLKDVQSGKRSGVCWPGAVLKLVELRNVQALEEVYCGTCGVQTANHPTMMPVRKTTTCRHCSSLEASRKLVASAFADAKKRIA